MVAKTSKSKLSPEDVETRERELVEAAQRDPSRFGELYERHFNRVHAYVARRVRNRHAAEDLTSDVFYRALANLTRFEWRGAPFGAWLLRIAANAIVDWSKRGSTRYESAGHGDSPEATIADRGAIPGLEEAEHQARLFGLVDELPDYQRRVVLLRFGEEKSVREIARRLGRTEGAVRQLQFRALERLRVKMGESDG
jgi:RNA polymerase sigma-70 factor (ECF subfamily)